MKLKYTCCHCGKEVLFRVKSKDGVFVVPRFYCEKDMSEMLATVVEEKEGGNGGIKKS